MSVGKMNGLIKVFPQLLLKKLGMFCLFTAFLAAVTVAHSADALWDPQTSILKVSMPIYPDQGIKPLAFVRADKVFVDHQRHGFFKIGFLPLLAMERFSIELCDTNQLAAALAGTQSHFIFRQGKANVAEGRDFSVLLPGNKIVILRARTVRLENEKEWKLTEGTISRPGTAVLPFHEAKLIIAGTDGGTVVYKADNGVVRIPLLPSVKPAGSPL
jgi:hypothetical protein